MERIAGRFELERQVGQGAMGAVFRAVDHENNRPVAIKLMLAGAPLARFEREATLLAQIDQPNVVRHVAHGVTPDGRAWLAMDWLDGEDLGVRLEAGPLAIDEAIALGAGAAAALGALHARGLVHRDVKPDNLVLVGRQAADVRLVDFGIVRSLASSKLTHTGAVVGTPAYMAPEQVRASGADARTDVFALGAVLYECITGRSPFASENALAALAKILLESPAPLATVRPEIPRALGTIVDRMLAKDPDARPSDGAAVARGLASLDLSTGVVSARGAAPVITSREERVVVILIAGAEDGGDRTLLETARGDAAAIVHDAGGDAQVLASGALLALFHGEVSPVDAARKATRCGLAIAPLLGNAAIATGKAVIDAGAAVGEVIERAARLASGASGGMVLVDASSRTLVDDGFELEGRPDGARVIRERSRAAVAGPRLLLGKPTRCLGRDRELAAIGAVLEEVRDDGVARAVLLVAAPGAGKSFLSAEVVRRARSMGFEIWSARGASGGAFSVVRALLEDAAGVGLAAVVLGRLVQVESTSSQRAPAPLGEALETAWEDWISAECASGPRLVFVDDLHWADVPSVKLLDTALRRAEAAPLFVIATARPEVHDRFPVLWRDRNLHEVRLGGLSRRAAEALVRSALGVDTDPAVIESLVVRAAGNPFFLEELVRAVADGARADALPDGIHAMMQARIDALGGEAKHLVRAPKTLAALAEREALQREASTIPGEEQWTFRHALLRETAYASLVAGDREAAHRRCAEWLEAHAARAPFVLASHWTAGGESERAVPWFALAGQQALDGGDFQGAVDAARAALVAARDPLLRGRLLALVAEARFWQGRAEDAEAAAVEAAGFLERGSAAWYAATGTACAAAGQRGDNDRAAAHVAALLQATARDGATAAKAIALGRGASQLVFAGRRHEAEPALAELACLVAAGSASGMAEGWARRARADAAIMDGALYSFIDEMGTCVAIFEREHAVRVGCLLRLMRASARGFVGDPRGALEEVEDALAVASRFGWTFLIGFALMQRCGTHVQLEAPGAALADFDRGAPLVTSHPRIAVVNGGFAAAAALDIAPERAAQVVEWLAGFEVSGWLAAVAPASRSRWLTAVGRTGEAIEAARIAVDLERSVVAPFEPLLALPQLALTEALLAGGDAAAARESIAEGVRRLRGPAELHATPERVRRWEARAFPNRRAFELAGRLGAL